MYLVAIAWLYVVLMMAITETSIAAGIATFLFYGLFPLALFLWLFGTPHRKRMKAQRAAQQQRMLAAADAADTQALAQTDAHKTSDTKPRSSSNPSDSAIHKG